jgi:glycosyltransferase involved in cell wall biosynthesis
MISIIICTYNRDKYIYKTLEFIAKNDYSYDRYEIILVNNNSADDTESECFRFRTDYTGINFRYFIEANQGLSFARNRGIIEAQGDLIVFLDDDSFVEWDYLKKLDHYCKEHPDMIAFGGKISPLFETGIVPAWLSTWSYSWVAAINMGDKVKLFKGNRYPIGANMGFKKEYFAKYGVFSTSLGRSKKNLIGGEEKDIFNRSSRKVNKIYYFPEIQVQHVIPESRTTKAYIKKLGKGVGISEKVRTLEISEGTYFKRIISEIIKWCASIFLFALYTVIFQPQKGTALVLFRWHVSKGLFKI